MFYNICTVCTYKVHTKYAPNFNKFKRIMVLTVLQRPEVVIAFVSSLFNYLL